MPRSSAWARAAGASGQLSRMSRGPSVMLWATWTGVSPVCARWPLKASNATTASAYTSAPGPAVSPLTCSGAMYEAVPSTVPLAVMLVPSASVAMPRSASLATPSVRMSTLAGLTSLCTMPLSCTASSAAATSASTETARSWSSGPALSSPPRVVPSTYSITISTDSPSVSTSYTETRFGWLSEAPSRASRWNRRALSSGLWACSRLTATWRPSRSSSARNTRAMPPVPITRKVR